MTRWTGYDEIIRIVVKELRKMETGTALANWLAELASKEYIHNDKNEMGWGFYHAETGEIVDRTLYIGHLTPENQELFWQALQNGCKNLLIYGKSYSFLNPERPKQFLRVYKLSKRTRNPLEHSDWNQLDDAEFKEEGPGWD